MEVPPHRRHVYVANARKYLHQACKLEFVYSVLPLMALLNDLGELLPHLPALRPPRLLDLAAGVLMGLMNTLHIQDELVTPHNQDITLQNQLSTETVDKLGLDKFGEQQPV
jgi:hypothetical protein